MSPKTKSRPSGSSSGQEQSCAYRHKYGLQKLPTCKNVVENKIRDGSYNATFPKGGHFKLEHILKDYRFQQKY